MKKKKTGLAIFLIIWGAMVTLIGTLLVLVTLSMILDGEDLLSAGILAVILLAITLTLGVLPLIKGICILRGKEKRKQKVQSPAPPMQDMMEQAGQPILQAAPVTQTVQSIVQEERVIHEEATPVEKFVKEQAGKQILCKDEQFDDGDWPMVKAMLKVVLYIVLPIAAICIGYTLVTQSAGGRIQPNTWQAWASMLIVVGGCFLTVLGMVLWSKYNAIGNKFFYFVVHEDEGVSVAHLDTGRLGAYVADQANVLEKIKAAPSLLYVMLFFLCSRNRRTAIRLARMQMYFNVNQKYHFIEKVLMSTSYDRYSDKIVGVSKIKYFSKGCEVWYTVMQDGVQQEKKQYIYRETTNYELLLAKLKELCPSGRVGYELSDEQVSRVRKNIYRRLALLAVSALVCVLVLFAAVNLYYEASYKAEVLNQAGAEALGVVEGVLASRSRRRAYYIVYFMVVVMGTVLLKLLADVFRTQMFTYVPTEVLEYHEKTGSIFKKLTGDYRYFATVRYKGASVTVGLSKEMWEQKEQVKPLLILRKNVPYCVSF